MAQLTIELPDELSEQLKESTLTEEKLNELVARFIHLWLQQETDLSNLEPATYLENGSGKAGSEKHLQINTADDSGNVPRFGSGKHLNITMSDDFDEPLEDFAEYMR